MSLPQVPPLEGRRAAQLDVRELSADRRSCQVSFSSETDEVRIGDRPAILVHEPGCADFSRINSVLWSHDPRTVIGKAEAVHLDAKTHRGRALVTFDDDETSLGIWRKVKSGSVTGASVGFLVDRWEAIDEGESWRSPSGRTFQGPAFVASKWRAYEFSLVACPADSSVGIGRSTGQVPRGVSMDPTMNTDNPIPSDPVAVATELERARCLEIDSLCSSWGETAGLAAELKRTGATVEAARAAVLRKLAETRQPVGTARTIEFGADGRDKFRDAALAGLLTRAGLAAAAPKCEPFYCPAGLRGLALECIRRAGGRVDLLRNDDDLFAGALNRRAVGSHTTSDFPYILANVADKSLQQGWKTAPATYEPLVRKRSVSDFKSVYSTKLGDAGLPELTPDGSPMPESSLAETGENYRIYTYAKRFSITRATLVNDDLDAFSRIPALMGAACRRKVNSIFWDLLTSASGVGPTMTEDGEALFSLGAARIASSGINYTTGAAAIGITTLSSSKALMRRQKGMVATGETAPILDIQPDFLIVPSALEMLALQYLATIAPATNADAQPEWVRRLRLVVEPSLDDATNGTTAWYLAASPSQMDGFEMAFLDGREEPTLIEVEGTNILGKEWGVYFDAGCKCVEHRSWMRNRGA